MTDRPFYPDLACSDAPLREGHAPKDGCDCRICDALRRKWTGPVKPGTPEWTELLRLAGA